MSKPKRQSAKRTVKLGMDDSRIKSDVTEAASLTKSLERLLQRVRRKLLRLRANDIQVRIGKPALRAGNLVCVPQILSRDFELAVSALRALELDVAHKILDG